MDFREKVILAPLAGITDTVYRTVCRQSGCDITVSEMVSAQAIKYGSKKTISHLHIDEKERPAGIQIFGSDPGALSFAAGFIEEKVNPDFIDLNCGCPVPKVVKKNGGSALMKDPDLFEKIVSSIVNTISVPFTVKIRSGWDNSSINDTLIARIAQECGASVVAIHARTRAAGYSGRADWSRIKEVKKSLTIPVIGNGDITTPEGAVKMFESTGCDSVMIGRGAIGSPWIFRQIKELISNGSYKEISNRERLEAALEHIKNKEKYYGEEIAAKIIKKDLAYFIKGIPGSSKMRKDIFSSKSSEEMKDIIRGMI